MPNFYSQHGEDFILNKMFEGKKSGFFVEVGCIDGRRFSNTLCFEELGWRGICIEAHTDYVEMLSGNRPFSTIVHCAVGDHDQENAAFFANSRGSLSTLDRSKEYEFRERFGDYFSGFVKQSVPMMTLNTIFVKEGVAEIDFVSIDVEGSEVEALQGLNLQKFRPRIFVIESEGSTHEKALDYLLLPAGYQKSIRIAQNIFYIADRNLERLVKNRRFSVNLIHTAHPLDLGNDEVVETTIDTRKRVDVYASSFDKIKRKANTLWHKISKAIQRIFSITCGRQNANKTLL